MRMPEFIKFTNRGYPFPNTYFAPRNEAAYYLTCVSDSRFLTEDQMTYLTKAGVKADIQESKYADDE